MMDIQAENTHQVFEWLWSSGQLTKTDIFRLEEFGFEVVINLALPSSSNALFGETELVTGVGMVYVQIPVIWENPTLDRLDDFFGVMKVFEGRKVWVHCAKNMRVSAFLYLYRKLIRQEPESAARFPMDKIWKPNAVWQKFIDQATEAYSPPA